MGPRRVLAIVVACTSALAACSAGDTASPAPGSTSSAAAAGRTSPSATPTEDLSVARIGVLAPSKGELASTGADVRAAVALAIAEANAQRRVPGWRFELADPGNVSNQATGQQAASVLAESDGLLGVVGGLTSSIDDGVAPVLNSRGIPLVGPAATADQLTRRTTRAGVVRPFGTYFRLAPRGSAQGPAAATFLDTRLRAHRVAIVSDGSSEARTWVRGFRAESRRRGVHLPVRSTLPALRDTGDEAAVSGSPSPTGSMSAVDRQLRRLANEIADADVDAVFAAGSATAAVSVGDALTQAKVDAPMIGAEPLLTADLSDTGEQPAEGDYAVFAGAQADALPSARGFVRRFLAAGHDEPPGAFAANAYDATWAIVDAFGSTVERRTTISPDVLADVVERIGSTRRQGATGLVGFDAYGDAIDAPLAIYRMIDAEWSPRAVVRLRRP